jgi:hypothetical protein
MEHLYRVFQARARRRGGAGRNGCAALSRAAVVCGCTECGLTDDAPDHGDWIRLMARVAFDRPVLSEAGFRFVRHNNRNETILRGLFEEADGMVEISAGNAKVGTGINLTGNAVKIDLLGSL